MLLFSFCYFHSLNDSDPSNPCVGERHAPLFHMNTCVLNCALIFMAKAEIASLNCYLVGIRKCCIWFGITSNCFELSSRSCLSSCIM